MDVKTAIETADASALSLLLSDNPARANELISWGRHCEIRTHPLHYVSDMLFNLVLPKGRELPLIQSLLHAGADIDFQNSYFTRLR